MKMVKSLLLGSAAGVVAVAGAQAADLPVKAKAVEYVKICSLYGAGFYYIPGTDICLKVGGYMRYQVDWDPGNSVSAGPMLGVAGIQNRISGWSDMQQRSRAITTFDTRTASQYGVVRTYLVLGVSLDTVAAPTPVMGVYANRAFIQFAGFTFGKTQSFFDIMPTATIAYNAGFLHSPDTGDVGEIVAAYTANFGGGVSFTIAAEQQRTQSIVNTNLTSQYVFGTAPPNHLVGGPGGGVPDIVGAFRIDQAWGSILLGGAAHAVSADYYGATEATGHPSNKWGWAGTAGFVFNLPMIAPGDRLMAAFVYGNGATRYVSGQSIGAGPALSWQGGSIGWGFFDDGVYGGVAGTTGTSVELTTAWSLTGAFEHLWTPALRTSIYGTYFKETHTLTAATAICNGFAATFGTVLAGSVATPATGCNPDFSMWGIGSRTQWEPVRNLYIGVDVMYQKLQTATLNAANIVNTTATIGGKEAAPYAIADQSTWTVTFRVHRDFVP